MEQLMHYVWKHKMFPLKPLTTTDGRQVTVLDTGLHNSNAGPDFFNAKLLVDGTTWVGNVEIHLKASQWFAHGHDKDAAYNNVVMHVVGTCDAQAITQGGRRLPQMVLQIPQSVMDGYRELLNADRYPPCHRAIPGLSGLLVSSWMAALQTERLEQKTNAINERVRRMDGSWQDAYFITMARNYGFGVNGDAFETWAYNMPLRCVAHHRDQLFQVEALFMGQAGLLDINTVPQHYRDEALREGYITRLQREWAFLSHKFRLKPMDPSLWRFLRMRPQNFPHIRISQLARLYHQGRIDLSRLVECTSVEQLEQLLTTSVTPYWETHYTFGSTTCATAKHLSRASLRLLVINTAVPMLFAYGRHKMDDGLCQRAFSLLDELKAENNNITRMWQQCGLPVRTAGDSQALIQLKREYCDKKDCLRCRFGYETLRKRP